MPKMSKQTAAKVDENGPGIEWRSDLEGYATSFVHVKDDADLAPLMKGLPDDRCQCPHWGYVFEGSIAFDFGDHVEVYEAGDAFYVPTGHTPSAKAGAEFLLFSPVDEYARLEEVMAANAQKLMQGA